MFRRGALVLAVLLLAGAAAGWLLWRGGSESQSGAAEPPAARAPASRAGESRAERPEPAEVLAVPSIPAEALADRRDLGTGESEELLSRLPTRIDYPLQEKYRDQVWSDVPHELLAAHDGSEEHEGEGARRLFVVVVEPGLSDAELTRLVRDLRARHRDAEGLRIRVFDSRDAATTPSWTDGGAAREAHLLADLYRDPARERFRVRGREVDP